MELELIGRGLVLGFTIAAAVGPIGLLCIRRTLADGAAIGFVSGLGAATADAFYGAVAAFGLTAISDVLVGERTLLGIVGAVILAILAVRTLSSRPTTAATSTAGPGFAAAYGSTLALTVTNPMTIVSFASLFAALGVGIGGTAPVLVVGGVFVGSTAWWAILASVVARLRSRVTLRGLRWVNAASGSLLLAFAVVALWTGLSS